MNIGQLQVKQQQYERANNAYVRCLQDPSVLPEHRLYLCMAADRAREAYEKAWHEYQQQAQATH